MTQPDRQTQRALFDAVAEVPVHRANLALEPGAVVLYAFALEEASALLAAIDGVASAAPWRHMATVRGWRMSVAMTNCGDAGWVSDRSGYRYDAIDPETSRPWPAMPGAFADLARRAAAGGRLRALRAGCLPDQPLRARRPSVVAPGSQREGFFRSRSCQSRSASPQRFIGAAALAAIGHAGCVWNTATWSCGAVRRA